MSIETLVSDRLRHEDEITVLELLNITSDDLVDNFGDRIDERTSKLARELGINLWEGEDD